MRTTSAADAFGTVLTAMVTPFRGPDAGEVDLAATAAVARHLVDNGCDGLVVNGTTGESPTTDDAEQLAVVRAVLDAVGDRARVVAGVGTNDTRHSVLRARDVVAAGAHGLLVVNPYYSRPSQAGIVAHIEAIADATPAPVMLYDIPARSAVALSTATILRLARHPRVLAVQDAKGDLQASSTVMAATDLAYYSGDDALTLPLMACGAIGTVSVIAHAAPRRTAELVAAMTAGDLTAARAAHVDLLPVVASLMGRDQGAVTSKVALQLLGVLTDRSTRLPLPTAPDDLVAAIHEDLTAAGVLPVEVSLRPGQPLSRAGGA